MNQWMSDWGMIFYFWLHKEDLAESLYVAPNAKPWRHISPQSTDPLRVFEGLVPSRHILQSRDIAQPSQDNPSHCMELPIDRAKRKF